MAHGHKRHPDTDTRGDTIEFAAVELEQPERVCYELRSGAGVHFNYGVESPVEIRIGQTTESSPLFVHPGTDFPELCEMEGREPELAYVLMQPDVFAEDPKLGRMVLHEWTAIGRSRTPQFRFGPDISRKTHIELGPTGRSATPEIPPPHFAIVGCSANPTKVIVDRREYPFENYELNSR
jgi:hypothetical protein